MAHTIHVIWIIWTKKKPLKGALLEATKSTDNVFSLKSFLVIKPYLVSDSQRPKILSSVSRHIAMYPAPLRCFLGIIIFPPNS